MKDDARALLKLPQEPEISDVDSENLLLKTAKESLWSLETPEWGQRWFFLT